MAPVPSAAQSIAISMWAFLSPVSCELLEPSNKSIPIVPEPMLVGTLANSKLTVGDLNVP